MVRIVSTGKTLSSPEYHQKKKERRKRKLIIWSAVVILVVVAVVMGTRIGELHISEVRVEGAQVVTSEEISRNVLETLRGRYLWLIPKANAALLPRTQVRKNLEQEFPRLRSISLSLDGRQALAVTVTERKPFALYCPSVEKPKDASACFFLDENGFIFDEAPAFSGAVYFVYASEAPLTSPKGTFFLETERFQELSTFVAALSRLGFEPLVLKVGEKEATLTVSSGAKVVWNLKDDSALLYSNLESLLATEEIKKDAKFLERVRVLDLRTPNKVFYRFQENESGILEETQ